MKYLRKFNEGNTSDKLIEFTKKLKEILDGDYSNIDSLSEIGDLCNEFDMNSDDISKVMLKIDNNLLKIIYDETLKSEKEDSNESKELKSKHIDIKKLESIANSIAVICNNEYGDVFFNESIDSVFVCLGDANPFNDDLEEWLKDCILKDYKHRDSINVEVDMECGPSSEEEGWLKWDYNSQKWVKLLDRF